MKDRFSTHYNLTIPKTTDRKEASSIRNPEIDISSKPAKQTMRYVRRKKEGHTKCVCEGRKDTQNACAKEERRTHKMYVRRKKEGHTKCMCEGRKKYTQNACAKEERRTHKMHVRRKKEGHTKCMCEGRKKDT